MSKTVEKPIENTMQTLLHSLLHVFRLFCLRFLYDKTKYYF